MNANWCALCLCIVDDKWNVESALHYFHIDGLQGAPRNRLYMAVSNDGLGKPLTEPMPAQQLGELLGLSRAAIYKAARPLPSREGRGKSCKWWKPYKIVQVR